MKSLFKQSFLALAFLAAPLVAENSPIEETGDAAPPTPQLTETVGFAPKVSGMLELRPSWSPDASGMHTENTLNLGYDFTEDFKLDYTQYFLTNISIPGEGLNLRGFDGFLRGHFKNVWTSVSKDLSFDIEQRIYAPTDPNKAGNGFITASRTYFNLTKTVSPSFSIIAQEIPIFYVYNRSGTSTTVDGVTTHTANAIFENRFYLTLSYRITSNLTFDLPFMFWATRLRNYGNGTPDFNYMAMIWPELSLVVAPQTTVGLSYYSGNLLQHRPFPQGVTQAVFRQTL